MQDFEDAMEKLNRERPTAFQETFFRGGDLMGSVGSQEYILAETANGFKAITRGGHTITRLTERYYKCERGSMEEILVFDTATTALGIADDEIELPEAQLPITKKNYLTGV